MKLTAFSYSRLTGFEECPKRMKAVAIDKIVTQEVSDQMAYGSAVHKSLELRISKGRPLPAHLAGLEPTMGVIAATPGTKLTEYQMAINASMEPTSWFGHDVYCRAVADLVVDMGKVAALFDYKTGRRKDDFLQLKLTAGLYFQHAPQVERIRCAFVWTKDKEVSQVDVPRDSIGDIWAEFQPRIDRYQKAFQTDTFPARPGRHCRWCPVKQCTYWGDKR